MERSWIASMVVALPVACVGLASFGATPVLASSPGRVGPVHLNEHEIRERHPWIGAAADRSQGEDAGRGALVTFDDPRSILRHVLRSLPEPATVFPSEQYYYYRFALGSRLVSGNIRLVDAAEGRFSVGYFDAHDPNDMRVAMFEDGRDEVTVKLGGDGDRTSVRIAVADVQRTFLLDDRAFAVDLTLLDGERIVSGLLDESGHFLVLIFNEAADRFYYVRNPAFPAPEVMVEETVGPHVLRFGERSRFCFLVHPVTGREILIAVHADQIRRNTWYDGPFDQVPPRLSIGDLVRRAYPYVEDAGGVDEHGVFLERPDSRIAISPYIAYESGPRLIAELATRLVVGPGPEAWLGAVEERKNTWRATDAEGTGVGPPPSAPRRHESLRSRTWPPNHWAASSRTWPAEHDAPRSTAWPPNRMVEESREPPPSTPR